ncbi:MAG: class I SAM-dependent methyltransferase [Halioglobus sp.]
MNYSDITINDPNRIKRYLQQSRYRTAVDVYPKHPHRKQVLDFGGGDGELCLQLSAKDQESSFLCYEPALHMQAQAEAKIGSLERIRLIDNLEALEPDSCDVVYSLEVFEHLPPAEFGDAIEQIFRILRPGGKLIIGVPNELFLAAIYKGIFRMLRRFGDHDARPWNILRCALGRPPKNRPTGEISPGKKYHFHHLGFDHRDLRRVLNLKGGPVQRVLSPTWLLGGFMSPEIYYIAEKGTDK